MIGSSINIRFAKTITVSETYTILEVITYKQFVERGWAAAGGITVYDPVDKAVYKGHAIWAWAQDNTKYGQRSIAIVDGQPDYKVKLNA